MKPKDCGVGLTRKAIGAAIAVHRTLGPGLLESVYERALLLELAARRISARNQFPVAVFYRGHDLGIGFRVDFLIETSLVVELSPLVNSIKFTSHRS